MRVSWQPAASAPSQVSLSAPYATSDDAGIESSSSSSSRSFAGISVARVNPCSPPQGALPVQGSPLSPVSEVKQLREEVARLRSAAQHDAKERETLLAMIDRLKTQLRHALDENRSLTDGLEERKEMLDAQSAKREAAVRESALNCAKQLFSTMLKDADSSRAGTENRNSNRDHAKASHPSKCDGHKS